MLFNSLREWRTAKAHEEGVPPFLVFTNRHLLQIVAKRPESNTALLQLSGIGPGKVGRYGQELLVLAHTSRWPKSARFTLCQRVQNAALDVTEMLVMARYEPKARRRTLRRANLTLERMLHGWRQTLEAQRGVGRR